MGFNQKVSYKVIIFFVIALASLLICHFIDDKEIFINFFFLPVLLAGYAYEAKGGVIAAIVIIIFVSIIAFISFENYDEFITKKVTLWGCFLIISGYIIGRLTEKVNAVYMSTITTLAMAMESRDPYTYGHSSRVAEIATRIAKKMGFSKHEQDMIMVAGILHDIGKFGVREDILRKKEPLTSEEYDHIRQHPLIGASILSPIKLLKNIIPYIYYHHEHVDGTGYLRKKGSEIPLPARILAVADAYDAMTTDRPYRNSLEREEILKVLNEEKDKQFDKDVVNALLSLTDNLAVNITMSSVDVSLRGRRC